MAIRILEFDSIDEMEAYMSKASPKAIVTPAKQEPKPVFRRVRNQASKNKEYTDTEIQVVRDYFHKNGKLYRRDFRRLAKDLNVRPNRVHGIYYTRVLRESAPVIEIPQRQGNILDELRNLPRSQSGRINSGELASFANRNAVSWGKITRLTDMLSTTDESLVKTKRHRFMWRRIKAMQRMDPKATLESLYYRAKKEWYEKGPLGTVSASGVGKHQIKAKIKDSDLEFPSIYPLSDTGVRTFEQMMVDLIAKKHGKIDYYLASSNLDLSSGKEWDNQTWTTFCEQVLLNSAKMAKALVGCDGAKIKVVADGRSQSIRYG